MSEPADPVGWADHPAEPYTLDELAPGSALREIITRYNRPDHPARRLLATLDQVAGHTIAGLIERSSLGTPGARALRSLTPPDVVERILARTTTGGPVSDADIPTPAEIVALLTDLRDLSDGTIPTSRRDEIMARKREIIGRIERAYEIGDQP